MLITLLVGIGLMGLKFLAFFITDSNAILTDALESIINVTAGAFALFSVYYASFPKDENHPYGHGKIEYFSAGVEGGLILLAGTAMIIKSGYNFFFPVSIQMLDMGVYLSSFAGFCNYLMGRFLIQQGGKLHSTVMIADGKHLISDTLSSIGMIVGLLLIHFTQLYWLDNVIAIILGAFIFYTGYKLIKESVTNLLDEADYEKLEQLIEILNKHRRDNWIDMHNLRVLKYGARLHIDAHITLPWYENLVISHGEVRAVEELVKEKMENDVELFIHADPCLPTSCSICTKADCTVRKGKFVKKLTWTLENILPDKKHSV